MLKTPYNRYVIAALLRGHSEGSINKCLRGFGLCESFDFDALGLTADEGFLADKKAFAQASFNDKLAIARKYNVHDFIAHALRKCAVWVSLWDIASVPRYREYIFVLGSVPDTAASAIANGFNKKFSRNITKAVVELMLQSFWNLNGLITIEIKNAINNLSDKSLAASLNKLLYGDAISAARSVGAPLRLSYANILEEMLFEAYHRYKQCAANNAQDPEFRAAVSNLLKIGDRFDKVIKSSTEADVLHDLLKDLQFESDESDKDIGSFLEDNELV